jgi:Zn-finger nucleic acid-binding protein
MYPANQMKPEKIGDVTVDFCTTCKGIWFDKDELRQSKDQVDADLCWMDFELFKHKDRFAVSAKPLKCPTCDKNMVLIDYDNTKVQIDYCPECEGLWLERGEFAKIVDTLTEEMLTKDFSDYIKASLEEAKEIITGSEHLASEWKDFLTVFRFMQYRILTDNPSLHNKILEIQKSSPFT